MKKIWVLRYNDGTADVWDEEKGPPSWPYVDAFDVEGALKELISEYAALRARNNELVEAVKKYFKSERLEILKRDARAEVGRLIAEWEGEG